MRPPCAVQSKPLTQLSIIIGRVKVCVRVRPPSKTEIESKHRNVVKVSSNIISLYETTKDIYRTFAFDTVFPPEASQKAVYDSIASPIVKDVMTGVNGTIMAYGQTGTGKTYTMGILGSVQEKQYEGIVPRCIKDIFDALESRRTDTVTYKCKLSFLQIYMEMVCFLVVCYCYCVTLK